MKNINKILAVSFIAMLAVPAAQAKIVSETMLSSEAGHYSGTHTVQSEINAKQDTLVPGTNIEGAGSVTVTKANGKVTITGAATDISGKQDKLNSGTGGNVVAGTATGNVVTSITASNGTVTVNKASGVIKNVDIASDAAIAKSKLASGVQTSLDKADSAVQSVTTGTSTMANGTISVDGTAVAVKGLGTAAYTASTAYDAAGAATTAQANAKTYTDTEAAKKVNIAQGSTNKDKVMITDATNGNVTTTAFIHATGGSYTAGGDDNDKYIPSVELVENIAATAAGDMVDEDQGTANKNRVMSTTSTGKVTPGTLTGGNGVTAAVDDSGNVSVSGSNADASNKGVMKLYTGTGSNTDGTMTQKAITDQLATKQGTISDLSTIRSNASAGKTASDTIATYGDIVTHDAADFDAAGAATTAQANAKTYTDTEVAKKVTKAQGTSNKQKVMTTNSSGNVVASSITGSNGVSVSVGTDGGVTVSGTTYSTGNGTTAGLTKLYTGTGSNTDGAMTQSATTTALNGKQATLSGSNVTTTGTGTVVTEVTANNGSVTVTKGMTAIPVPSDTTTDGTLVLTAHLEGGNYVFEWESLGR